MQESVLPSSIAMMSAGCFGRSLWTGFATICPGFPEFGARTGASVCAASFSIRERVKDPKSKLYLAFGGKLVT
jgi:hypothetical protein